MAGQRGGATKTVIVYESMFGNTRALADAIAKGLGPENHTVAVPVAQAGLRLLEGAGLVVAGGPTHVHGMSRANTRKGAADVAGKPGRGLKIEPGAQGPGLRDWFALQRRDDPGGRIRHPAQGPGNAHRPGVQGHRQAAPSAWLHFADRAGELSGHQGQQIAG